MLLFVTSDLFFFPQVISPVAKFARLSCVFLCSSDMFLERPVQKLMWGLFRLLTRFEETFIKCGFYMKGGFI